MRGSNKHFDFLARVYDKVIGIPDPQIYRNMLEIRAGEVLLDAGGGTGRATFPLSAWLNQVIVSDISVKMLRQANRKGLSVICSPVEKLPFPDESIDLIMVVDAFHHFTDQFQSLLEFYRILKPGGRLLIEEPDLHRFPVKIVAILEKLAFMRSHFYYPEKIAKWMTGIGFQVTIQSGSLFRSFILGKKEK